MTEYNVNIHKKLREDNEGNQRAEIWADITDMNTGTTMKKRIWWEDDNGIYHDETPELSADLRHQIDNIWIEKSRKW